MTTRPLTVFISSTYLDMLNYRTALISLLNRQEIIVRGMEYLGSRSNRPKQECLSEVRDSQVYIGVFGTRYGSLDPETGKSMTHLEYEEAQRRGLRTLIYLIDEDRQPVLPKYVDTGTQAEKLKALKAELVERFTVGFFTTPDDLARRVSQDISEILLRRKDHIDESLYSPASRFAYGFDVSSTVGSILKEHRENSKEDIHDVVERVQTNENLYGILSTDKSWYSSVERGNTLLEMSAIPAVAAAYNIDPSILQALASPPQNDLVRIDSGTGYVDNRLLKSEIRGALHRIPSTRLAGSSNTILRISLDKSGTSILHRHLGEEIVYLVRGCLTMRFPNNPELTCVLKPGDIAHFDSGLFHQAVQGDGGHSEPVETEWIAIRVIHRRHST